jgi:16S rRNA (guanine966-N2)-methyltransferase
MVPKGYAIRPTPDLVKQAVFNSLGDRVGGARVLELFAGSGALSIECLSRGAVHAVCVEKSQRHAGYIRTNLELCRLKPHSVELRIQDVFAAIHQLAREARDFDLVVADPPYGEKNVGRRSQSFAQRLLDDPQLPALLSLSGVLVLGHSKRDSLELPPPWTEEKCLRHGDSRMRFLYVTRPNATACLPSK